MVGFRHASRDAIPAATLGSINFVDLGTGIAWSAGQPQYMAWVGWDEVSAALTGYSSDGGKTWTPFASTSPGHAGRIAISATDPNRLVWAPALSATPQYSTDAGATWHACTVNGAPLPGSWQLGNEWWSGDVLAADLVDGNRFYLYNDGLFYSSADGGVTWQGSNPAWPTALPIQYTIMVNVVPNPAKAGDVWVTMAADQNQPGRYPLFHSVDGGVTFSAVATADSANFVAFGKGADADHPAIYIHGRVGGVSTDAIYRSLDLGASWTAISDPTQQQFGNISALAGDMRQANLVYVGTGGRGIFYGYGPALNPSAPSFMQADVVNAASGEQGAGLAPGEIVTISARDLGPRPLMHAALDETGSRSTIVDGAQVFFDGAPAPLLYASPGTVEAVVPYSVAGNATTSVQASYRGVLSAPEVIPVTPTMPGIFTLSRFGTGSGSLNSPKKPAARGDYITILATGEGQTTPFGVDGLITGLAAPVPVLPVTVQIGGLDAAVAFAWEEPGVTSGVLEIRAQIPATVIRGPPSR